jgi:hypothetical protein
LEDEKMQGSHNQQNEEKKWRADCTPLFMPDFDFLVETDEE